MMTTERKFLLFLVTLMALALTLPLLMSHPAPPWPSKAALSKENDRSKPNLRGDDHLLAKMQSMLAISVIIEDPDNCLQKNKIDADILRKEIAKTFDVTLADTTSGAPTLTVTVIDRSAGPLSFRSLIMVGLTLTTKTDILYEDRRSDIYTGRDNRPLKDSIDRAVGRLKAHIALLQTH